MPIYEFLCEPCNTVFKFFSRTINTEKKPLCPQCKQDSLARMISQFSTPRNSGPSPESVENLPIDETKMKNAMDQLMSDASNISEEDPRQAARLMQKFSDMTGLKYNDKIQETLARMEAGEDMEQIESGLDQGMEEENPFANTDTRKNPSKSRQPRYNDTLFEM